MTFLETSSISLDEKIAYTFNDRVLLVVSLMLVNEENKVINKQHLQHLLLDVIKD